MRSSTPRSKQAPIPIKQEMLTKLARSAGVVARRRSHRLNNKIKLHELGLDSLMIRATQGDLIQAFNLFLEDHRDPTFRGLRLSEDGVCYGISQASSHFPDFEKMKEEILAATPALRKRLGSTAWKHIQKILTFIALTQFPTEPWEGGVRKVNFLNIPLSRSHEIAIGTRVRLYTACLDKKLLATALGKLKDDAIASETSASLPIFFRKHSIEIGYQIGKGYFINDPNAHKKIFYNDKHIAAREILGIYVGINRRHFVEPFTRSSKIFIHVSLRERDQLPTFERYMKYWTTRSMTQREDATRMSALTMFVLTGNFEKISGFLEKQLRRDFIEEKFQENNMSELVFFLKNVPVNTIISLLKNEDFIKIIRNEQPYSDQEFDQLLYSFRFDTTTQVTAAIIYAGVKRTKQTLSSLILIMFDAFHDPRLVGLNYPHIHNGIDYTVLSLVDIGEVIKLIGTTGDIQTKVLLSKVCDLKLKKGYFLQEFSEDKYSLLLLKLYFSNSQAKFSYYAGVILNAARTNPDAERREFLRNGLSEVIKEIAHLSVWDNKADWTLTLLCILSDLNTFNADEWVSFILQHEKMDVLITVTQNFNFTPELGFKLLCVAIENCSLTILQQLIQLLTNKGVLQNALIFANSHGDTVLHMATYKGKIEYVRTFLALGCAQYVSARGETPLYIACAMGHVEIAQQLIMQNQTPIQSTMPDGRTIFLAAKNSLNPHMLEQLILLLYKKNPLETIKINALLGNVVKPHVLQPNSPLLPPRALPEISL